jgi:outer membrane protein assembly factor BamE (lipoprotein component of BamABCDE complex)
MKKILSFLCLVVLCAGCFHRSAVMTQSSFADIEPGMSIADVEKNYGKPFQVHSRDGNSDIYEYIERIMIGPQVVEQRSYYLIVANNKVVGKYMKYSTPPAYEEIYRDLDPFPNY